MMEGKSQPLSFVRLAGWVMPYLTVGMGLYVYHNAWVAILAYHAGILLFLIPTGGFELAWNFLPGLNHPATNIRDSILFGALGLFAGVTLALLWPFLHVSPRLPQTLLEWGLTPRVWPWFIVYFALANPWLEELYWRSWHGSPSRYPVLADFFFAGFHLVILAAFISVYWLAFAFLILSTTAWVWRRITVRYDSLLASSLFHLAADVSILLVVVSEVL
jgi:hypothetical protein